MWQMWQEYEGDQWDPHPRRKRTAKGRLVSTLIPTEIDENENERENRKNMEFADMTIIETIVSTCLHLKFFLDKM
ncbi:hypothetical protein GmHk_17G049611 [Glycine max]|nr:hypothetical protein GmHk_17G049611 [Glycine max]